MKKVLFFMKHYCIVLSLILGLLLIAVNVYAAGDLIVEGDVGVGTTTPITKLDVNGGLRVNNVILGTTDLNLFGDTYSSLGVTLKQNGNVGIGTTTPTEKLDVRGNITATQDTDTFSAIYLSRSGGPTSGWNSPGGTWGVYRYGTGEGDRFSIGIAGVNEPFRIHTDGNVIMGVTSTGASSGNVGVGVTAPNTKVDIDGDVALRAGAFTATNGNNNNINIGGRSFIRITGPTAAFTVTGIAGGVDGKVVILYNATTFNMTIANESTSSTDINRITTLSGSGVVTTGVGAITLIYDSTASRWIVTSARL